MARRRRKGKRRPKQPVETERYADPEGNVLVLRKQLSPKTVAKISEPPASAAADAEDAWQRREEMLFERLAVSWEIAGLEPLSDQRLLLGRYRMAEPGERRWVRETIHAHLERWIPAALGD